jgi:hypothetical protein
MFLTVSSLPYSLYGLLIDESRVVDDSVAFRPDRIVSDYYGEDFLMEIMCNEVSNVSPLSTVNGVEYRLPSSLFVKTFLEVAT